MFDFLIYSTLVTHIGFLGILYNSEHDARDQLIVHTMFKLLHTCAITLLDFQAEFGHSLQPPNLMLKVSFFIVLHNNFDILSNLQACCQRLVLEALYASTSPKCNAKDCFLKHLLSNFCGLYSVRFLQVLGFSISIMLKINFLGTQCLIFKTENFLFGASSPRQQFCLHFYAVIISFQDTEHVGWTDYELVCTE